MGFARKTERPQASIKKSNDKLFKPTVQAKLKMGSAGDKHEQQADRIADGVVQKMEEKEPVQMMEEEEPVQKMGKEDEKM